MGSLSPAQDSRMGRLRRVHKKSGHPQPTHTNSCAYVNISSFLVLQSALIQTISSAVFNTLFRVYGELSTTF